MIEDLAIKLVLLDERVLLFVNCALIAVGAIIAAILSRSTVGIARAPYFALSAVIVFAISVVQTFWLSILSAIAGGFVWLLVLIAFSAQIAAGYMFCLIALARSRDAFGHGRLAILGFIPIANFWLLLTPSKSEISSMRVATAPLLSGGYGVLTAIVAIAAATGVNHVVEEQTRMLVQQTENEPSAQAAWVRTLIGQQGLEETLLIMAAEASLPFAIDEVTTLTTIEASGTQLRRTYVVGFEGMTMTEEFRTRSRNGICAWPSFEPILLASGSIREVYVERSGREIGSVLVTREECEF